MRLTKVTENYADRRKINPAATVHGARPDGSPDDNDRVEIGPTALSFNEWKAAGLEIPQLAAMRSYRLERLQKQLQQRDLAGILLFDPLNIRYASDTSNMQLWATHNSFRACFVSVGGYMIIWDYKSTDLLTAFNPLVRETRGGASFFYFVSGDHHHRDAKRFAAEIDDLMRDHSGTNRRLAVDKIMIEGLRALDARGIDVVNGEEVMEKTRAVKGPDEILAMRCAVHACEQSVAAMHSAAQPGLTENDVWSVLHTENIRRGGEWIETRLLSSGPRTNPWFQECGPRVIQNNELLAFDTDLIGCYGTCCDMSRTWFIGDGTPSDEQRRLFEEAYKQIEYNKQQLAPGRALADVIADFRPLPARYAELRYSCSMHGVGLCDEWPLVTYQNDYEPGRFELQIEPGMTLCVEAYIGVAGGSDGIKLEDQLLITETGIETLTLYPFDERLMA